MNVLTISASSDYLRCTVANPEAANTINTIYYLFVGLYSVHWHFRHLQIPVDNKLSVNLQLIFKTRNTFFNISQLHLIQLKKDMNLVISAFHASPLLARHGWCDVRRCGYEIPYIEISFKIPSCYVSLLKRRGPKCATLYGFRSLYLKHMGRRYGTMQKAMK